MLEKGWVRAAQELGIEGLVAKRKGSLYEPGRRSGAWLKYRINRSQEFVIGGYTHGHPFDALIVGVYDDSGLKFVEKVRAGFVGHMRAELHAVMKPLLTERCPFVNLPEKRRTAWSLTAEEMKNCCWVKPELVATESRVKTRSARRDFRPFLEGADEYELELASDLLSA